MCSSNKIHISSMSYERPYLIRLCWYNRLDTADYPSNELIRVRISFARQAVILDDNFMGFGYMPDFTPAHHVDLLTGKNFKTSGRRKNPVSGSCLYVMLLACI